MIRRFKAEIPECEIGLTAPGIKSEMNLPEFYQGAHYGLCQGGRCMGRRFCTG